MMSSTGVVSAHQALISALRVRSPPVLSHYNNTKKKHQRQVSQAGQPIASLDQPAGREERHGAMGWPILPYRPALRRSEGPGAAIRAASVGEKRSSRTGAVPARTASEVLMPSSPACAPRVHFARTEQPQR